MNRQTARVMQLFACLAISSVVAALMGCGSNTTAGAQQHSTETETIAASTTHTTAVRSNPRIDLQCEAKRIRNAPSPFHWSFRKTVPPFTNADWEADVTPSSIVGTLIDSSGTRAIHGARSDSTSWDTAVMILTAPLPTSTFALVNNSSAIVRAGEGNANGEDAIKYTIDTSRDTPADAFLIRSVLGANGFIRGAAWVMRRGCPAKFVLDVEQHNSDGTVEKGHYEANVTRK